MQLSHVQYPHQSRQNGSTRERVECAFGDSMLLGRKMWDPGSMLLTQTLRWDENSMARALNLEGCGFRLKIIKFKMSGPQWAQMKPHSSEHKAQGHTSPDHAISPQSHSTWFIEGSYKNNLMNFHWPYTDEQWLIYKIGVTKHRINCKFSYFFPYSS